MRAINDKIIINPFKDDGKSEGGIILDTVSKAKYSFATVVSAGEKCEQVKDGDVINYDTHAGLKIEDNTFIIREQDVQYILPDSSGE